MPPQDHYLTPFVRDSFNDIITESMNNMQRNDYNGICSDVKKLKTQSSSVNIILKCYIMKKTLII